MWSNARHGEGMQPGQAQHMSGRCRRGPTDCRDFEARPPASPGPALFLPRDRVAGLFPISTKCVRFISPAAGMMNLTIPPLTLSLFVRALDATFFFWFQGF